MADDDIEVPAHPGGTTMATFPLDRLGGRAVGPTTVEFGVLLPWVTPGNGQSVEVRIIHEKDQFLQRIPTVALALTHGVDPDFGDLWTGQIDLTDPVDLPAGARWGSAGAYVYRLVVTDPRVGRIDWIIDPYAREFGVGKQSAVLVGADAHTWPATEDAWRTPALRDLVLYEINLAELHRDAAGAVDRLDYLADLGVSCLSIMPVSNIANEVDWGYLPVGYFGVDERFGGGAAFKTLVAEAHRRGLAVIVDAVYGHASRALFAYQHLYDRLGYDENPFMGPFAADLFADQGASIDYRRPIVPAFFAAVNQHWLDEFHVDGFRYDCVPNSWDGPVGVGYAKLVYDTHRTVAARLGAGELARFGSADAPTLIQCAEQLEDPVGILKSSASTSTWQNETMEAAHAVVRGDAGAIDRYAAAIGLQGYPTEVAIDGRLTPKTALQYLENHDHSRFLADFGVLQPDEAHNDLFLLADRRQWYRVQPYLISLLLAKGIPMLFEGQELAEDFTLPGNGLGRISLLRPVSWDYFYDDAGRTLVTLVRRLLAIRRERAEVRSPNHFFVADRGYQLRGVMVFTREVAGTATVVAVNFTDQSVALDLVLPTPGTWHEELSGTDVVVSGPTAPVVVPSSYGLVLTS